MSDERLRELERRWEETGAVEDEAAYLLERVRAGELTLRRLGLAAYCGHEGARVATEGIPCAGFEHPVASLALGEVQSDEATTQRPSPQTWVQLLQGVVPSAPVVAAAGMIAAADALFVRTHGTDPCATDQRRVVCDVLDRALAPGQPVPAAEAGRVYDWLRESNFASDDLEEATRGYLFAALADLCSAMAALAHDPAQCRVACGDAATNAEGIVNLALGCERHEFQCDHDPEAPLFEGARRWLVAYALAPPE